MPRSRLHHFLDHVSHKRVHKRFNANALKRLAPILLCSGYLSHATAGVDELVPEVASQSHIGSTKKSAISSEYMAVTANPYATRAAKNILEKGGNAIDAAIAAQLVLGLTEPQSSGIGGGAFMLYWDNNKHTITSYDGRETAPRGVNSKHFQMSNGKPMAFYDAVVGGHAVGVPGVLDMLAKSHERYGKLNWKTLFSPAIALAEDGFNVSPRLHQMLTYLQKNTPKGVSHSQLASYFFDNKQQPWPVGYTLKNPDYAKTLRHIAENGVHAFYNGKIARQIVKAVQNDSVKFGKLSLDDLNRYSSLERTPLCLSIDMAATNEKNKQNIDRYKICGAPPPSSGASTVLTIVATLKLKGVTPKTTDNQFTHLFAEASKLAFADRNLYIADPDFVEVPTQALLEARYLYKRARLISSKPTTKFDAGNPLAMKSARIDIGSPELPSTSHFSIVDKKGNAISMTSSIETAFGSRIMVGGFLLNNQLTDFSFTPRNIDGVEVANRIQPLKRPRSSMAPTIVLKNNKPYLLIGSPGGARIIHYVSRILAEHILMGKTLSDSLNTAHIVQFNGSGLEIESDKGADQLIKSMKQRGHKVNARAQTSGIHLIHISDGIYEGIADPRREGTALGGH